MDERPFRMSYYGYEAELRYPLSEPRSDRRMSRLSGLMITGAASIFFVLLWHYVTHCDHFRARRIVVTGTVRLSPSRILLQAGLGEGMNILSTNLSAARKRLLAHPWVAGAAISLSLPPAIHVRIREHHPLAVFDLDRRFIVNQHGEIFKTWEEGDPADLPVVTGLKFSDISLSDGPYTTPFKAVMNVLQFKNCVPGSLIREVRVDREMGITLMMAPDPRLAGVSKVRLGYRDYSEKYERLEKIFVYLREKQHHLKIGSVDLSNPDRVIVNPIRTESLASKY